MRKWWLLLLALLVVGGGYFGFKFYKNQSAPVNNEVKAEEDNIKKDEKIETEEVKVSDEENNTTVETNVEPDKAWDFSFSFPLNPETVNSTNITVKDSNDKPVQTTINLTNNNKTISISPPSGGYKKGETYSLHIENGISYSDGEPVSKPYDLTFEVDRDEVEKATLNKNLVIAKKSQVISVNGSVVKLDKSIKKDLKVNDIVVIPTEDNPEGYAAKIATVNSDSNIYTVDTFTPSFSEIYEDLEINKTYSIKPEDITLNEGIEGIEITPISQAEENTMIASANTNEKDDKKDEYKLPKMNIGYTKSKGFQFKVSGMQISEENQKVTMDGSFAMLDPKVDSDVSLKMFKIKKMKLAAKSHVEQDTTFKLEGFDKSLDKKKWEKVPVKKLDKLNDKLQKGLKIATVKIPTSIPGASFEGAIYFKLKAGVNGEQTITSTLEVDTTRGFIYENGKTKPINTVDVESDYAYKGNSIASVTTGPSLTIKLKAFKVLGGGTEVFGGGKIEGQFAAGTSTESAYVCGIYSTGFFGEISAFIDLSKPLSKDDPHRLIEYKFGPYNLLKTEYNTCMDYRGIESDVKTLDLEAGDDVNVNVIADYLNYLTSKHEKSEIKDYKIVKTSSSNKDVVKVKKKKKSLTITALDSPSKKTTNLTIKYTEKSKVFKKKKTGTIAIPITITNYDDIVKKAAEAKAQEEAKLGSLKGEWSLVNDFGGANLNILDVKNNRLKFEINASSGGHATGYEGTTAKIKNDEALYVDEDTDCYINFVVDKKDTITVYESPECNLNNVSIEGDYKKGQQPQPEQKSLTELTNGEISEERDEAIRNLVGEDYDIFVTNTQQYVVDGEEDVDAFGSTVITTAVPGLYKYNESIIMLTTPGDLFLATIVDGEKVRFYTDNELYQDKLPLTIQNWMSRFSDYPVEYRYKPITEQ